MPCARAATRCGAFPALFFAPRTVLPSMAITSRPPACTALVCSQAPRTRSSTSALTSANARRNVDSSAGPRAAPSTASTSGPASAAHCPIAANDLDPAITAAIPTASSPASGCRRPRLFRGSGTWARRSRRYWLRAAGIGEDGIGGRASLVAGDGECRNFHRSARAPPAARRHAGHITHHYDTAGHSLTSRLCRVPGSGPGQLIFRKRSSGAVPVACPMTSRAGRSCASAVERPARRTPGHTPPAPISISPVSEPPDEQIATGPSAPG